jgi:hypothetical protein
MFEFTDLQPEKFIEPADYKKTSEFEIVRGVNA